MNHPFRYPSIPVPVLLASACAALVAIAGETPPTSTVPLPPNHSHWAWWAGEQAPLFDEALSTAGLDHQRFRFATEVVGLWGGDAFRIPAFNLYYQNPWNCSPYAREAAAAARRGAPSIQELQVQAQSATGIRVRDNFYSSALKVHAAMVEKDGPLALANALEAIGAGKANEIADAIRKGGEGARANQIVVSIQKDTIAYEVIGRFGASRVLLKPASPGTGVIAAGGVRAILEAAGVKNILTKQLGSRNPNNVVKATMDGLKQLRTVEEFAAKRGLTVPEVLGFERRNAAAGNGPKEA